MLRRSLAESAGHFWWPEKLENVANLDFGNLKYLQNPGHLLLTAVSIYIKCYIQTIILSWSYMLYEKLKVTIILQIISTEWKSTITKDKTGELPGTSNTRCIFIQFDINDVWFVPGYK